MKKDDFHILFDRYANDIFRFALFMTGDTDEAKDITSETFVRLFSITVPIVEDSVKAYLLKIAKNLILENRRRKNFIQKYIQSAKGENTGHEIPVEKRMELKEVLAFLQLFPEEDRTALMLRAEGLSYREIAAALDITIASAKIKVHRLRKKLLQWKIKNERSEP